MSEHYNYQAYHDLKGHCFHYWIVEQSSGNRLAIAQTSENARTAVDLLNKGLAALDAPDLLDRLLALVKYHWLVDPVLLYDEEGVEGWSWSEPDGTEHTAIGDWNELPTWPDSARRRIADLEGRVPNDARKKDIEERASFIDRLLNPDKDKA